MRRPAITVLLLAGLIFPLLASGCGALAGSGSTTHALRVWYGTDDPVEREWAPDLARRFEQMHPGSVVQLSVYSFEDLNTKLQLALSAGDPPDLAYVTPRGPGIPAYVGAHRLRNLTAASHAGGWSRRLRTGLLNSYNEPFSYFGAKHGQIMAVPMGLAAVAILYNTHLLQRLHLSIPRSLRTFQADLALSKAHGYVPLGLGNGDGWLGDDWYLTLVNSLAGPSTLRPEQQLAPFSFKRPPFTRAARLLQTWSRAGYFTPDFGGLDAQEGIDQFFHGTTVFQLVSSSEDSQIAQDQRQTHLPIGIFAFPSRAGGTVTPYSGYEGWVVPIAARRPVEAESFITMVTSTAIARFLLAHSWLPARSVTTSGQRGQPGRPSRWQTQYLRALNTSEPGVYLDAAPIGNLNATMEANVQLLLQGYEPPAFLVDSLQEVYSSRGKHGSTARIDGEF